MSRVYETAIKIGATISRAFKGDTYDAAKALTKLGEATKQLKSAEKSAAAFKKLDGEVSRAKARYDTASSSLRKLEEAERAAGGATKESTKWRKAGAREVAAAARQLDRATTAAKKNGEALRKLGVDTSKVTSEQVRLAKALAATERQEKALDRFQHARERLFGKREKTPLIQKGGEQLRGVGESVLHLAEGALVAGEAMHILVEKTMHAGAEVGESAEKLGIGAKALQELRYGARQSGAEVEDLDRAIAKMAVNIGKHKMLKGKGAGAGSAIPGLQMLGNMKAGDGAAAADPFKQIGLRAKDLATLKPEEQIRRIADGMAKLKTHAERAAIAQEIFGKGATAILPFLAEGSEGIDKLSKSANKFGGVLSDESVAAAIEAEKASKDMDLALGGLANTLGAALLPTAVKVFRGISKWIGENREQIKKWAENAAKWIEDKGIPAFKRIAVEVQAFAVKVAKLIDTAARLSGGFGNLAIIVAGLRLAPLALTFGKIGIEGTKAAIAIYKYVAAKKAAAALGGGIDGMGPGGASAWAKAGGAIGVAASAAMVIGAAGIGVAIGTAIDSYFHISDRVSKIGAPTGEDKNGQIQAPWYAKLGLGGVAIAKGNAGIAGHQSQLSRVKQLEKLGYTYEQASAVVFHGASVGPPAGARARSAGGGGVHVAPVLQFYGPASRADVANGMDAAKQKALEEFDKRDAHRKRVAYGG